MANNLIIPDNIDSVLSAQNQSNQRPISQSAGSSKLIIPDNIDDAMKNHIPQIPSNSVPVAPISNTSQIQPSSDTILGRLSQAKDYVQSGAYAALKGVAQGSSDILSTIDKAVVTGLGYIPALKAKIPNASDIQSGYNYYTDKYNKDADTNAHPFMSGVGRMAGQVAMTTPLGALTGGGAVAADAASQLGLGLAGQTAARVVGSAGTNALQGMAQGALTNTTNQGSDVINQQGAKTGMLFGGTVGALGSGLLGSYGKNLQNYQNFSQDLSKAGYKGPVFSTDVPANQGVYNSIKQAVVNGVVSKIPIVNNIPGIGVQSARDAQTAGIQDALKSMASKFSDADPATSQLQFANAIKRAKVTGDKTISDASNNFRQILTNQNINDHALTISRPIADDILNNNSSVLSNSAKDALSGMSDAMTTDSILGTAKQAGLKQRIWNEYERLSSERANTLNYDAATKLNDLYHSVNKDLLSSVGFNTKASEAFHNFNTVTQGVKALWDPMNSPALAKAFKDINGDSNGMMTFFNKLQKGSLSPQAQSKYSNVLGPEGNQAVSNNFLNKIFTSNIDESTGKFNLTGLLHQVDKAPSNLIPSDIKDSLNGLQILSQKLSSDISPATADKIAESVGKSAVLGGAAAMSNTVRVILGTGAALGAITAHTPLKNTLMWVNKTAGKTADGNLSQFLIDKASKYFTRLGVSFITNPDGNIEIKKESEVTKPKALNPTLGLYD